MTEEAYFEEIGLRNGFNDVMFVLGLAFTGLLISNLIVVITLPGSITGMSFIILLVGGIMIPSLAVTLLVARRLGFVWTPHGIKRRNSERND